MRRNIYTSGTRNKRGSGEEFIKKKFNFRHEEKRPLKKYLALHDRILLKSAREIYMGVE
jgi:hypothetical protein